MTARTLRPLALFALFALAACTGSDDSAPVADAAAPDTSGWRLASGKAPSKAEFSALAATCEAKGGAVDSCLTDLGLRRAP
jgi:hypothetical protein